MLIQKSIKPVDKFANKDEESAKTAAIAESTDIPTDDYRIKREKNNESVRKSRAKNRVKVQECAERVKALRDENVELNSKLNGLQTELSTLRNLFQYCFSFNTNQMPFKPSEVPTSTLYKIIMQNKTKFMQPVTNSNLTETIQQATSSFYSPAKVPTDTIQIEDEQREPMLANYNQEQDHKALFDDKDSFFINELKQSLIDFIKYEDSNSLEKDKIKTFFSSLLVDLFIEK